jgi:hypothetical protein
MYLFFGLVIIFSVTTTYLITKPQREQLNSCKARYAVLKEKYISLARSQIYWHDLIIRNKIPIKQFMKEYNDLNDEEFQEGQRRKLVKLKLDIDRLENE